MNETDQITPENEERPNVDFAEMVEIGQNLWNEQQSNPFETLSQSWQITPEMSKRFLNLTLDNMPDYVGAELVSTIKENHPVPIIGYSVLADKRLIKEKEEAPYHFWAEGPNNLEGDSEKNQWQEGINILNEIATDTLALDILKIIPKGDSAGFSKQAFDVLSRIPGAKSELQGILIAEEYLTEIMGEDNYKDFRQKLIVAMLSGDNSEIESYLQNNTGSGLNDIALQLREITVYGTAIKSPSENNWKEKLLESSRIQLHQGQTSISYPGVINMDMLHAIDKPYKHPRVIVHELCHYISQDNNHFGLFEGGYKKNEITVAAGS